MCRQKQMPKKKEKRNRKSLSSSIDEEDNREEKHEKDQERINAYTRHNSLLVELSGYGRTDRRASPVRRVASQLETPPNATSKSVYK